MSNNIGEELKDIISRFGLIDRTFENARENIDNFVFEEKEKASEYGITSRDSVKYDLDLCSYNISDMGLDTERQCIEIRINYYCQENVRGSIKNRYMGHYSALYDPCTAEIIDDFIVINL